MARRTKRRGSPATRKRPVAPQGERRAASSLPVEAMPPANLKSEVLPGVPVTTTSSDAAAPTESRLPRKGAPTAPANLGPETGATPAEPASATATQSLLPRRTRVAGRAEIRRRQEATLEPLDESPAVPLDRTPYLPMDVRKVAVVSSAMLVLVILGLIFIH